MPGRSRPVLFFFNDTATTEIYTLSLHDALPILHALPDGEAFDLALRYAELELECVGAAQRRSEEHTSELQSQSNLVCRLLLEKKKKPRLSSLLSRTLSRRPGCEITTVRARLQLC